MSVFFAVAFPVILLVFFSAIYGSEATWGGLPLPPVPRCGVLRVRRRGHVVREPVGRGRRRPVARGSRRGCAARRCRHGRTSPGASAPPSLLGLITVVLVFGIGAIFFGVRVGPVALLLTVAVYVLIIASAAALGMLLASLVDSPQSAIALALATLLPLSMISDIFVNAPDLPPVLSTIGWIFPLRHMSWLATQTAYGAGVGGEWLMHAAAIAVWGGVAALLAWRLFRWEPRHSE